MIIHGVIVIYMLIQNYNNNYKNPFGNGWKLANKKDGYRFSMSSEDKFIYLFMHYMKHYLGGGIGCRHIVDLWVYLRNHQVMNFEYIESVLEKLSALEFYRNTIKLLEVWFADRKPDYVTNIMINFMIQKFIL